MEILYLTKEECFQIREEEFLVLKTEYRFMAFLELSRKVNQLFPYQTTLEERTQGNFILERRKKEG